jgi:beta-galactosidase
MRKEINFNCDWVFHKGDIKVPRPKDKGPVYTQAKIERRLMGPAAYNYVDIPRYYQGIREIRNDGWEVVNLPHDYIIDQDNDPEQNNAHGYFKYDNAWYRKRFTIEEDLKDKRVTLQFEGVAGKSEVYLNGCLVKRNFSTYNSFEVDISNNIYYDKENVLAVYTNTEDFEGWWYQGGGIYRNVKLVITEPVSIDLYGVYAPYKKLDNDLWQINFETTLRNDSYENAKVEVLSSIIDADGNEISSSVGTGEVALREKNVIKYIGEVKNPKIWDIDSPNLYTIKTVLKMNGEIIDENYTRTGFRTFYADPEKGFFLNGRKVKIKGVCGHQDFGLAGLALPDNIAKYRIKLIKEMGANGFRTAHYQHCNATMDALDELGFIVMDEARWFGTDDDSVNQLTTLIKRDRNRPSVFFWSTSNEEKAHITDVGERVHKALYQVIHKLDSTRFITAAEDSEPAESCIYSHCDVLGINYRLETYDTVHKKWPNKPIVASECGVAGTSRDWHFPDAYGRAAAWDKDFNSYFLCRETTWKFVAERDYVMGMYQWVAIDHRGEAAWPMISSKSGSIDMYLQKKSSFYINKSHWSDEPMVHILPHWDFKGLEGEEIKVTVYNNCDEVELILNGKSLGKQSMGKYDRAQWQVPYEAGTITAKGYQNGKLVAEDERVTTGEPHRLRLTQNAECLPDGSQCALFTCEVLDENGNVIPTASEFVEFFATNGATVLGTGSDFCDHVKVTSQNRKMYMGKISIAVRPQKDSEYFELYAKNDKLGYGKIRVEFK